MPPDESKHAARVLRVQPADEVLVFDGRGTQLRAVIDRVERSVVLVRPIEIVSAAPEPAVSLTLLQSVIKSSAMDEVVRNAVMIGVTRIRPVVSATTAVARPPSSRISPANASSRARVLPARNTCKPSREAISKLIRRKRMRQ